MDNQIIGTSIFISLLITSFVYCYCSRRINNQQESEEII